LKQTLRIVLAVFAVCGLCATGYGQVVVEPEVATDTIDIFQPVEQSGKSRTLALVGSLVLPGLGHAYLGKDNAAMAFFTTEAVLAFGGIFCRRTSGKLFGDARAYAFTYANLQAGAGADELFWKAVGSFMDTDEYNRVMELNRTTDDKLIQSDLSWRWADRSYLEKYGALRENATRFRVASSFFFAGMALDRIVAFVQIRQSMRHKAVAASGVEMRPSLAVSADGAAFTLQGAF
jgi:hypothetical protein